MCGRSRARGKKTAPGEKCGISAEKWTGAARCCAVRRAPRGRAPGAQSDPARPRHPVRTTKNPFPIAGKGERERWPVLHASPAGAARCSAVSRALRGRAPRGAERPGPSSLSCADDKKSLPHCREGRTRARAGLAGKPGRRGQVLRGGQSTPWPRPRRLLLTGSARPAQAASRQAMTGPRRGSTSPRRLSRSPGRIARPRP